MPKRFFSLCIVASLGCAPLQAYQPIYQAPIDIYILKGRQNGPLGLKVVDKNGKVLEKARYTYNSSARLVKESYYNTKGEKTGHREYRYTRGKLSEERLIDISGKLLYRVKFIYDSNLRLQKLRAYKPNGKIESKQVYYYNLNRIESGLEISQGYTNEFKLIYEKNKKTRVIVSNRSAGKILEIAYIYDRSRRLIERRRRLFQGEGKLSRCIYKYDPSGRLQSYIYQNKNARGKWDTDKKFILTYFVAAQPGPEK